MLICLGWTRPRVFAAVLGEVTLIGLTDGVLGALLSPPLAAALRTPGRALINTPIRSTRPSGGSASSAK